LGQLHSYHLNVLNMITELIEIKSDDYRNVIAEPGPVFIITYFNRIKFLYEIVRGKTIVDMIRLILMPVHIKRRMLFFSLRLFKMMMIGAVNSFFLKSCNNCGMISFPPRFIPNGIAIKVAN